MVKSMITATKDALVAYILDHMGVGGANLDADLPTALKFKTVGRAETLQMEDMRAGPACRVWCDNETTPLVLVGGRSQPENYIVTVTGCGYPRTLGDDATADATLIEIILKFVLMRFPMALINTGFVDPRRSSPIDMVYQSVSYRDSTIGTENQEYVTTFTQRLLLRTQLKA